MNNVIKKIVLSKQILIKNVKRLNTKSLNYRNNGNRLISFLVGEAVYDQLLFIAS